MLCADVNVLVYAHRPESPRHDDYRAWLEQARRGVEPLGLPAVVLSGFVRVVIRPGDVVWIPPGERHWQIFTDICRQLDARGNAVPDAFLAAIAIEQGATWVSADRGFAGFPGLRWVHPLGS